MKHCESKHNSIRVFILLLLCLVCAYTFQVRAQESCYEQYLREHNMTILTTEDADDSYEEQKKAALAKQMYNDSYLLMLDTVAERAVIAKADGTYIADVHMALVDSTWYMWLSVDPLADKNIMNSPYVYCSSNPIMMIDLDGRDDEWSWDGTTATRVHVDNGTDYVKVNERLITDYDYSNPENRAFLAQIGEYYMVSANISKPCIFYDTTSDGYGADALAHTNMVTFDCGFVLNNGKLNAEATTVSNIVNSFVHEEVHTRGVSDEIAAISAQMKHKSWATITESLKLSIYGYGVKNANLQLQHPNLPQYQPSEIESIFDNNIIFINGEYTLFMPEICIVSQKK